MNRKTGSNQTEVPLEDPNKTSRLIRGSACTFVALFSIYEARRKPFAKRSKYLAPKVTMLSPRATSMAYSVLGVTLLGLGGLQFAGFDLPDFQKMFYEDLPDLLLGKED